jgi:hypothetical protein
MIPKVGELDLHPRGYNEFDLKHTFASLNFSSGGKVVTKGLFG